MPILLSSPSHGDGHLRIWSVKTVRQKTPDSPSALLLMLDEAFEKKTWHGPNLKGSLRGVTAEDAAWRAAPGRHNIWEIVVHAAYWKYAVQRRLRGGPRGSFAFPGSNWFARPAMRNEKAWREDRALLVREHRKLREAVASLGDEKRLRPWFRMIFGVAFHDVYHAGQIQLLKKFRSEARKRGRGRRPGHR